MKCTCWFIGSSNYHNNDWNIGIVDYWIKEKNSFKKSNKEQQLASFN